MTPTCRGTTKGGTPCRWANNLSEDGLCAAHDPARQEESRAIRVAGGKSGGRRSRAARNAAQEKAPLNVPPAPKTLDDATRYFAWIVNAVATGALDARSGHECAYALNGFKAAAEKRDLEREIQQLREELAAARRPRRA